MSIYWMVVPLRNQQELSLNSQRLLSVIAIEPDHVTDK